MTRVALLGLGRMGAAMAARLRTADHEVTVWNRSESGYTRLDKELASGARRPMRAPSAARAVLDAEVVFTVLADGPALQDVLFGSGQAAAALLPGALVCDLATIGVDSAQATSSRLEAIGHQFVDAPVSGSVATVRAGDLLVMAGGPEAAVERVVPVLGAFANKIVRVGTSGSGQAMKLSVNSIVHALNAALAEGLVLAERGGVERDLALEVIASSAVAAPFVLYKRASFSDPDSTPVAFTVDLMRKDLALIQEFAENVHAPMPVSAAVGVVADAASVTGLGDHDMSEVASYHRTQLPQ
jgi:3-hydroxyisobutyrate dehydrogenase-like beta-hydroxyacid dehydrogenase